MRHFDWQTSIDILLTETARIVNLCEPLTAEQFAAPVLIRRLTGMEDSSRHWSPAMVMEHLIITMRGMTQIAEALAQGQALKTTVSTAMVKPRGMPVEKTAMVSMFQGAADECAKRLRPYAEKASDAHKVIHPFFGAIPARGWVWVLGEHQKIHRKQIEAILAVQGQRTV